MSKITIAELRARNNKMTQAELAKELKVNQTIVSNWEKDQLSINGKKLVELAIYFQVSTDELLGVGS